MIHEDRVIEETALARGDSADRKALQSRKSYFKTDYISRETLKSFVYGTLCFIVLLVIWGLWNLSELVNQINSMDYIAAGFTVLEYYIGFIVAYLFITFAVYYMRYHRNTEITDRYMGHLKKLKKIYSREENLKL